MPFHCLAFGSAGELSSQLAGDEAKIYFHPSTALHPRKRIDSLLWVDQFTLVTYFVVLPYLSTPELVQMSQDPFPYPPQMTNGGSPLAHLSLSLDAPFDPSGLLDAKYLQLPKRFPNWFPKRAPNW
jgi:hypothetical protein